jgi:hypothetical protein
MALTAGAARGKCWEEMLRVERVAARVTLDDPAPALARAEKEAAAGDESWQQWVEEYRNGEALIVRLETTLEASDGDGRPLVIEVANLGVFLEKDAQPPRVEQQIGELATKDFSVFARELAGRGLRVDLNFLGQMYVHVELEDDVRAALSRIDSGCSGIGDALPAFDAGLSEMDGPATR